jgi:hypothetical protein
VGMVLRNINCKIKIEIVYQRITSRKDVGNRVSFKLIRISDPKGLQRKDKSQNSTIFFVN